MEGTSVAARRGRPRDPEVDARIRQSAIELFAESGWAGFSLDQVARRSGVGKASIYLRWTSRQELLVDALERELQFVDDPDTGSIRGDLLALALQLTDVYDGAKGRAYLRLNLEGDQIPGFDRYLEYQQRQMRIARRMLRRGISRGELPSAARVTTILDALSGGLLVHSLTVPRGPASSRSALEKFAISLVDFVLNAFEH